MDITTLDAGILDDLQGYIVSQFATFMGAIGPYHQFMYGHIPIDEAFSPGRIFAFGMKTSGGILKAAFSLSIVTTFGGLFIAWFYVGAAVLTLCAFGFLAIQVFVASTLFQLIILIGLFLLPFGIWKKTAFIVEPVFGLIAGYGVSLMVLAAIANLIVGYGEFVIPKLAAFTLAAAGSAAMFSLCAVYLAIYARKVATEMISGAPSMGAEEALNTLGASARALAGTVAAIGASVIGAAAVAGAATRSAQAALGGGAASSGASGATVSGTTSTGSLGGSAMAPPDIGSIKASGAMHARFQQEMGELNQKSAGVAQQQNPLMGSNVQSLGLKRIAKEMQATVGQEGGLSETAADRLKSRMDEVQAQRTANVNGGMDSETAAAIAEGGYQAAVSEAVSSLSPKGAVGTEDARESAGMHTLSGSTQSNDVMLANRMGIVGEIHSAALQGKSTRETMEALGDKMKPIEDAATMNGVASEANVHKMGIINSVRESLGVPSDKEGAKAWAEARASQSSSAGGSGGSAGLSNGGVARSGGAWDGPPSARQRVAAEKHNVDISGMTKGEASLELEKSGMDDSWNKERTNGGGSSSGSGAGAGGVGLGSPSNTNIPSVPNWLKKTASGRIMPTNTNGHGAYRTGSFTGE